MNTLNLKATTSPRCLQGAATPSLRTRRSAARGWLEAKAIPAFGQLGVGIVHPCFHYSMSGSHQMITGYLE